MSKFEQKGFLVLFLFFIYIAYLIDLLLFNPIHIVSNYDQNLLIEEGFLISQYLSDCNSIRIGIFGAFILIFGPLLSYLFLPGLLSDFYGENSKLTSKIRSYFPPKFIMLLFSLLPSLIYVLYVYKEESATNPIYASSKLFDIMLKEPLLVILAILNIIILMNFHIMKFKHHSDSDYQMNDRVEQFSVAYFTIYCMLTFMTTFLRCSGYSFL